MVERLCKTSLNSDQEMDSYKKTQERPPYDSEIRVLMNKDKALGDWFQSFEGLYVYANVKVGISKFFLIGGWD